MNDDKLLKKKCVRFELPLISNKKFYSPISSCFLTSNAPVLPLFCCFKNENENILNTPTLILTETENGDKFFIPSCFFYKRNRLKCSQSLDSISLDFLKNNLENKNTNIDSFKGSNFKKYVSQNNTSTKDISKITKQINLSKRQQLFNLKIQNLLDKKNCYNSIKTNGLNNSCNKRYNSRDKIKLESYAPPSSNEHFNLINDILTNNIKCVCCLQSTSLNNAKSKQISFSLDKEKNLEKDYFDKQNKINRCLYFSEICVANNSKHFNLFSSRATVNSNYTQNFCAKNKNAKIKGVLESLYVEINRKKDFIPFKNNSEKKSIILNFPIPLFSFRQKVSIFLKKKTFKKKDQQLFKKDFNESNIINRSSSLINLNQNNKKKFNWKVLRKSKFLPKKETSTFVPKNEFDKSENLFYSQSKNIPNSYSFPMTSNDMEEFNEDFVPRSYAVHKLTNDDLTTSNTKIRRMSLKEFSGLNDSLNETSSLQQLNTASSENTSPLISCFHNVSSLLEKFSSRRRSSTGLNNKLNIWNQDSNETMRRASEAIASSSNNFYDSFDKTIEGINKAIRKASINDYNLNNQNFNEKNFSINNQINFDSVAINEKLNDLKIKLANGIQTLPNQSPKKMPNLQNDKLLLLNECRHLITACKIMIRTISATLVNEKELTSLILKVVESIDRITHYALNIFPKCSSFFQVQIFATKLDQVLTTLSESIENIQQFIFNKSKNFDPKQLVRTNTKLAAILTQLIQTVHRL